MLRSCLCVCMRVYTYGWNIPGLGLLLANATASINTRVNVYNHNIERQSQNKQNMLSRLLLIFVFFLFWLVSICLCYIEITTAISQFSRDYCCLYGWVDDVFVDDHDERTGEQTSNRANERTSIGFQAPLCLIVLVVCYVFVYLCVFIFNVACYPFDLVLNPKQT